MLKSNATNLRNIYILSQIGQDPFKAFKGEFAAVFPKHAEQLKFQIFAPIPSWSEWIQSIEVPTILMLDSSSVSEKQDFKFWTGIFAAMHKLDEKLPILNLGDQIPSGAEAMRWIDIGCSGFLNRNFKQKELSEGLAELLELRMLQQARYSRVKAQGMVRITIASFNQALAAETLNLGQGGMFIRALSKEASAGSAINFELRLNPTVGETIETNPNSNLFVDRLDEIPGQKRQVIRGQGTVAWIRESPNAEGPEGMGIQFTEIDPAGSKLIENFVALKKSKYFIPLS